MSLHIIIRRNAHLFAARPGLMERMAERREVIPLISDQLFHPDQPQDLVVRKGSCASPSLWPMAGKFHARCSRQVLCCWPAPRKTRQRTPPRIVTLATIWC